MSRREGRETATRATDLWIAATVLLGLVAAALGGAGCRSPATHFYTLVPPAATSVAAATPTLQLEVLPVDVPADVDRAELVVRRGQGEVAAVDGRAWIAPLPQEIRRALAEALARELHARDVTDGTPDPALPVYRVKLVVRRFESTLGTGARALIDAEWTVRLAKDGAAPTSCELRASDPSGATYETLVEAHQRALAQIATSIAETVKGAAAGTASCPKTSIARP